MPASCLRLCKFLRKRRRCLVSVLHLHRLSRQELVEGWLVLFAVQWTLVGAHEYPVHDTGVCVFPCRMLSSEMHGLCDTHYKIKETLLIRDLQRSLNENVSSQKLYHLHIFHNAPYLPSRVCISIDFNLYWDGCNTQEKWKTKVMQNFKGQVRCIMGNVEVAYIQIFYYMFSYVFHV